MGGSGQGHEAWVGRDTGQTGSMGLAASQPSLPRVAPALPSFGQKEKAGNNFLSLYLSVLSVRQTWQGSRKRAHPKGKSFQGRILTHRELTPLLYLTGGTDRLPHHHYLARGTSSGMRRGGHS